MSIIEKKLSKNDLWRQNFEYVQCAAFFALGFFGTGSVFDDYNMAFLPIVLAFSSKNRYETLCISLGAFIANGYFCINDSTYIPYFLGVVAFTSVYVTVKSDKLSQITATFFIIVGKILFPYFYLGISYKLLAVFQGAMIYLLGRIVSAGREEIKKQNLHRSFSDVLSVLITCGVLIFSFSGAGYFYWSVSLGMCLSWLAVKNYRTDLCCVMLLFAVVATADRLNYIHLMLVFSTTTILGGMLVEKYEKLLFILPSLCALGINILFLGQLNGLAPFRTVLMAQVLYIMLPHMFTFSKITTENLLYKSGKDYRQLAYNMEKLTQSLDFLGNCAVDISKLNDNLDKKVALSDAVARQMCRKCGRMEYCWVEKFDFTNEQFNRYSTQLEKGHSAEFSSGMYSQCEKINDLVQNFEENHRARLTQKYISLSQKKNMKLLQDTILSLSSAVAGLVNKSQQTQLVNTLYTQQVSELLQELGLFCTYCICGQQPDKITFACLEQISEENLYKICTTADKIYNKNFTSPVLTKQDGEFVYTMLALPQYKFEYSAKSSALINVNGDKAAMFSNGEKLFCVVSDGMGTGYAAAGESETATTMVKSLLLCDVDVENAIKITNIALNLRGGECGATLDILTVNLYTGRCEIYKAGASETAVLNAEKIRRYGGESLPLGLVKDVRTKIFSTSVSHGDVIIMATDGIGKIDDDMKYMCTKSCAEISQHIMDISDGTDDKTVIAIKIKKCT